MLISWFFDIVTAPFVDIVLLTANSGTAIVVQVLFAIFFLKEALICKYDIPGLALILLGSGCIIASANFATVVYTNELFRELLESLKSISYFTTVLIVVVMTLCLHRWILTSTARFERDVDNWLKRDSGID